MDEVDIASLNADLQLKTKLDRRIRYIGLSNTQCQSCDNEIPEKRRKAVPGVTLCIACAELKESRQRQYARP